MSPSAKHQLGSLLSQRRPPAKRWNMPSSSSVPLKISSSSSPTTSSASSAVKSRPMAVIESARKPLRPRRCQPSDVHPRGIITHRTHCSGIIFAECGQAIVNVDFRAVLSHETNVAACCKCDRAVVWRFSRICRYSSFPLRVFVVS